MIDSCFCAPIHQPKFETGRDFIQSYNKFYDDRDIFLVFSTERDQHEFERIGPPLRYRPIVCTQPLGASPITQKKYFGLDHIFSNTPFRHVAVVDVDCLFIKRLNYSAVFEDKNATKIVYANLSTRDLIREVAADSSQLFSQADVALINRTIRHDDRAVRYFWFNDVPLYERQLFLDYMMYTDYRNNIHRLTYRNYDYVSYVYFLMVKKMVDLRTIDLVLERGMLEDQDRVDVDLFAHYFRAMKASWVKRELDDAELMKDVFLRLHVDR